MEIFDTCHKINDLLLANNENEARNELILLLDYHEQNCILYSPLVNHLIRETGLYPYMQTENTDWEDRYIYEAFKVPTSGRELNTLHREQSLLLKKLLDGNDIAVSAPTSFGKSFVIDAFISIKKPRNIVIIVPTVALTDETRRRLYKKFANEYKIITTTEVKLGEKNIFIFPQERAINYVNKIDDLDILIVDEFYKASSNFDRERAPTLLRAILKLGKKAKQKYFLAPNISKLKDNQFTKDFEFLELKFNTVFLQKHDVYKYIQKDENVKSEELIKILSSKETKSLIYAGTYSNITKVGNLLIERHKALDKKLLNDFSEWLGEHYEINWDLTNLVKRGTGIHNGQLHRSLSQIQVKLFEEPDGLNNIVSTSSIIEGVNTSAENVIIWMNKNGRPRLDYFTYKNIIGRGGRMFKHFVGKIYILDAPPENEVIQLEIPFPDEILGDLDEEQFNEELTPEQVSKIISYREDMYELLGVETYNKLQKENIFQSSDSDLIMSIATGMKINPNEWSGLGYLNSPDVNDWDRLLYKIINIRPGGWDTSYKKFVGFIKILSQNWTKSIPELLIDLDTYDIGIDDFFKLERNATYKFASLLNDVNLLQKEILIDKNYDISFFISSISHAFLPKVVYQLEEFGLPRMLSKKIHNSGLINFEYKELTLHKVIELFNKIGKEKLYEKVDFEDFDKYIIEYFYDGITINE